MRTTVNSTERVFMVITSTGKQAFCNIQDLNTVIEQLGTHEGYFKIYHFWNNKQQKASSKLIKEMLQGLDIEQTFSY